MKIKLAPTAGGRLVGEPPGTTLSEPTVASAGTLTVTGISEGVRYVGWANVAGTDHYLGFQADVASSGAASGIGPWTAIGMNTPKAEAGARTPEWAEMGTNRIILKGRIKIKELTKNGEALSVAKALPAPLVGCNLTGTNASTTTPAAKLYEVNTEGTLLARSETNNEDISLEGLSYFTK